MGGRDPKEIVRGAWNEISTLYRPGGGSSDAFGPTDADHRRWLRPGMRLKRDSRVLDLGCGCGVPDARLLSLRFEVVR